MNNSEQAKNGFKTFLITFGISLLIFGFFYYLLSDISTDDVSIEGESSNTIGYTKKSENTAGSALSGNSPEENTGSVAGMSDQARSFDEDPGETSPFGTLSSQRLNVDSRVVLSGADDQTTESTVPVPETGDFGITLGIVTSLSLLGFFVYIIFLNPRKYALSKFEEDVLEEL